jgi:MFS family permease
VGNLVEAFSDRFRIYYGWRVVATGFILFLLMYGARFSFGLYIKPMAESFGTDRASVSGSQSLYMMVYAIFSLVTGSLADRYGPKKVLVGGFILIGIGMLLTSRITSVWQYYLSYGILVAVGSGAIYVPAMGAVSKFFTRQRNFALGITAAGAGVGQFIFPPFVQKIFEVAGWQMAFFYTALLMLILGLSVPLLLLRGRGLPEDAATKGPEESGTKEETGSLRPPEESAENLIQKHYTLRQAMATRPFWTYFVVYFVTCFIIDGVILVHLYPYLTDIGFSGQTAASALGYLGLISAAAMIALGPLGDKLNKRVLMTGVFGAHVVLLFLLIHICGPLSLWGFIIFYGLLLGIIVPLMVSILSEIFGSRSVSSILGACTIAYGIAGLIAPWLAGHIFDRYHSYSPIFYLTLVLSLVGAVCMFYTRKTREMV